MPGLDYTSVSQLGFGSRSYHYYYASWHERLVYMNIRTEQTQYKFEIEENLLEKLNLESVIIMMRMDKSR